MNLVDAFTLITDPVREGGYQDGQGDPGGETKWGVSKRAHPDVDIKNLTQGQWFAIAQVDYWGPAGCDALPDGIKFEQFDAAFNNGANRAIKFLQQAVGAVPDGTLGPLTLQAVNNAAAADLQRLRVRMTAYRQAFDCELANAHTAGPAWMRRIAANMLRW